MNNSNVNQVKLLSVSFDKTGADQYNVEVIFQVDWKISGSSVDKFYLLWSEDHENPVSYLLNAGIINSSKSHYCASISTSVLSTFKPNISKSCIVDVGYSVSGSTEVDNGTNANIPAMTETHQGITGTYDGDNYFVKWNKFSTTNALTKLQFDRTGTLIKSNPSENFLKFYYPSLIYAENNILKFTLQPIVTASISGGSNGEEYSCVSSGIVSDTIKTYVSSTKFIDIGQISNDNKLTVSFELINALLTETPLKCRAVFQKDGHEIFYADSDITVTAGNTNPCTASFDIPSNFVEFLNNMEIRIYLSSGNIITVLSSADNTVSLAVPEMKIDSYLSSVEVTCSLKGADQYTLNMGETGKTSKDGAATYKVTDCISKTIKARAQYLYTDATGKLISGPYSNTVPILQNYFCVDSSSVKFSNAANGSLATGDITIDFEMFKSRLTSPISANPFTLTPVPSSVAYHLTFNADASLYTVTNLDAFVKALFEQNITAAGYYKLREIIARLSPCTHIDRLYYYCSASQSGRATSNMQSELLPGFTLKIESAYFNHQTSPSDSPNNGFIKGAVSEYAVSLDDNDILEFDSNFAYVAGNWSTPFTPDNNDISGMVDLFNASFKSSYYRIVYPTAYYPGDDFPDTLKRDGSVQIFAVDPSQPKPNIESDGGFSFRGRPAVTTQITVTVGGEQMVIPLGTTIAKLKARLGEGIVTKMYRQTGFMGLAPVLFNENLINTKDFDNGFFLLAGDNITIE
jgi:hypothetical protein